MYSSTTASIVTIKADEHLSRALSSVTTHYSPHDERTYCTLDIQTYTVTLSVPRALLFNPPIAELTALPRPNYSIYIVRKETNVYLTCM